MPNETIAFPGTVVTPGLMRPTVSDSSGVPTIDNSELRKIAEDALDAAKYAFASVAANPDQEVRSDSLEADFKEAFGVMDAARRDSVREKAVQLAQLPETARVEMFGRYGQMDTQSFLAQGFDRAHEALPSLKIDTKLLGIRTPTFAVPAGVELRATPEGVLLPAEHLRAGFEEFEADWEEAAEKAIQSDVYNAEKLAEIWGPVFSGDPFAMEMSEFEEFEEQAITDKLSFYITTVKCVDETNPEWWGHDEIAIAGVSVDETGDTKKIAERYVGGGFDDGDVKNYWPHWRYETFSLREGTKWPKGYSMTVILAEKDWGGLSRVLNKVWQRIKDWVKQKIEQLITAGLAEYIGPWLAKWLGKIVAWVVDKLVGWIIRAFADDIFPPSYATCTVPSYYARWHYPNGRWGSTTSSRRRAHFYGYGGHYYVEYYWKLHS